MKYLKKYNESVGTDIDYIKNCFIDLIDSVQNKRR
jgi:hypothetical protein